MQKQEYELQASLWVFISTATYISLQSRLILETDLFLFLFRSDFLFFFFPFGRGEASSSKDGLEAETEQTGHFGNLFGDKRQKIVASGIPQLILDFIFFLDDWKHKSLHLKITASLCSVSTLKDDSLWPNMSPVTGAKYCLVEHQSFFFANKCFEEVRWRQAHHSCDRI